MQIPEFSQFAQRIAASESRWLKRWQNSGCLDQSLTTSNLAQTLTRFTRCAKSEAQLMRGLRRLRNRAMLHILLRDTQCQAPLDEVLTDLSKWADATLQAVLSRATADVGVLCDDGGEAIRIVLFGMGKLGGEELNFSSDIDLVMAFDRQGFCETARGRNLSAEDYCQKIVRKISKWLGEITAEGFVYRVDWRLRPFGNAGRAALSFAAMETYFQREGRNWERYAWIKARPVAGHLVAGEEFLQTLRPFIYRKYLDYEAFDSLLKMKAMIRRELSADDAQDHLKLGPGGIRDIEFIVQAHQLVRGGRNSTLRARGTRAALKLLTEQSVIDRKSGETLREAYAMLRTLENRVQQIADQQTHNLPDATTGDQIAKTMSFSNWSELLAELEAQRQAVSQQFQQLFSDRQAQLADGADQSQWAERWAYKTWAQADDHANLSAALKAQGFEDADSSANFLFALKTGTRLRAAGQAARKRVNECMPMLLTLAQQRTNPSVTISRVTPILESIVRRSNYLALMARQPLMWQRVVKLCSKSSWVAKQLAAKPSMLDDLIDPSKPLALNFAEQLDTALEQTGDDGLEREMLALREVQQSAKLALAVCFLDQRLDAIQTTEHLTNLASALVDVSCKLAWRDTALKHGEPVPSRSEPAELVPIGYGSLGSFDVRFDSDLDLVFLYSGADESANTTGAKPVAADQFFVRCARRAVHILTTRSNLGRLYEVDMRLRPNGNSGMLVSSLQAFSAYQQSKAWVWELQALTRARPIKSDAKTASNFSKIKKQALLSAPDWPELAREIRSMREKMRSELANNTTAENLRHSPGGKTDIEFIAQASVLIWAAQLDTLPTKVDDVLHALSEQELINPDLVERVLALWRELQDLLLQDSLGLPIDDSAANFLQEAAEPVAALWSAVLED